MNNQRCAVLRSACEAARLPNALAELLAIECPWLDGSTEVSESLGPQLIAEQAAKVGLSATEADAFAPAYNAQLRTVEAPLRAMQAVACAEVCALLEGEGRADPFGNGDFWVMDESFSSQEPLVIVFGGFRFSERALGSLGFLVSRHRPLFVSLSVVSDSGSEIVRVLPS